MFSFGARRKQLNQWVEILAKGSLLGGLVRRTIYRLLKHTRHQTVEAGDVLMRQGDEGDSAYFVLVGELGVHVETPLGEVAMATIGPQQIVGEIAVFSRMPRTATVRAAVRTSVLQLSGDAMSRMITRYPNAALGLLAALGQRVAALNQPLAMLTLAAQALERAEFDLETMNSLFGAMESSGPFAQSFRKLLLEIEGKQSRRQEMLVAARLQQSILPRRLDFAAHGAPFSVEALMRPSRDIGGDFYDFFFSEDGKKAIFVVADVSGKGIPAALFMAVSRTLLRAALLTSPSIEQALTRANAQIEAENPECLFVTVFVAELDLATATLRYVNAGHCEGYVVRASGQRLELPASAPAVALASNPTFVARTVQLERGDRLLLISDGVTEAFAENGEVFGEERLCTLLDGVRQCTAAESVASIDAAVTGFAAGAEQSDDITCLALAYG